MTIKRKTITNKNNILSLIKGRIPGQLVIQITDHCNAKCPQCGMNITEQFDRAKLKKQKVRELIDIAATNKIQSLSFTGGEPFLYLNDLVEYINYATSKGIEFVRTGTNGFMFLNSTSEDYSSKIEEFVSKITNTNLRNFWISIDSSDIQTHETIRGLENVIAGIKKAIPIFHKNGIYPAANLGINRYMSKRLIQSDGKITQETMEESFKDFFEHVISLGFTMANMCYPMSINESNDSNLNNIYGASSTKDIVNFSNEEKLIIFNAAYNVIPDYRNKIQIFTPRISLFSMIKDLENKNNTFSYPCKGGIDFFFVDAKTGNIYPCGFRGSKKFDTSNFNMQKIKNVIGNVLEIHLN